MRPLGLLHQLRAAEFQRAGVAALGEIQIDHHQARGARGHTEVVGVDRPRSAERRTPGGCCGAC